MGKIIIKTWPLAVMLLAVGVLVPSTSFAQESDSSEIVPRYDISQESRFKGVVDEAKDRNHPTSGGIGSHLIVKVGNKIYDVHLPPVKFLKMYGVTFQKGDAIEIIGVRTTFHSVDSILPREIKLGKHDFVFRDEEGKSIW
jgi:hypothetical protein